MVEEVCTGMSVAIQKFSNAGPQQEFAGMQN